MVLPVLYLIQFGICLFCFILFPNFFFKRKDFYISKSKNKNGKETKRFCASSPSKITQKDVEKDIEDYTNSKLVKIACNDSSYLKLIICNLTVIILAIL